MRYGHVLCQRFKSDGSGIDRCILLLGVSVLMLVIAGCGPDSELSVAGTKPSQPPASAGSIADTDTSSDSTSSAPAATNADTPAPPTTRNASISSEPEEPEQPEEPEEPEQPEAPDHVWVDFTALRTGRSWVEVTATGEVTALRFGLPGTLDLTEVRTGTLEPGEVEQIFSLVTEIGFLNMESEDPTDEGQIYEGDILTISASLQGQQNSATFRPPEFVPDSIDLLTERFNALPSDLDITNRPALFIRAEAIDQARLKWLEGKNTDFTEVENDETLANQFPSLFKAKARPGRMLSLTPSEQLAIANELSDTSKIYLLTPDGPFSFELYAY